MSKKNSKQNNKKQEVEKKSKAPFFLIGGLLLVLIIALVTNKKDDTLMDLNLSKPNGTGVVIYDTTGQSPMNYKQAKEYSESEYLENTIFQGEVPLYGDNITGIDQGSSGTQMKIKGADNGDGGTMPSGKLIGISDASILGEFIDGIRGLIDGKLPEKKDECIISKELANNNNLKIGDTISAYNMMGDESGNNLKYTLTVVGIYKDNTEEYESPYRIAYFNRRNEIITSFETLSETKSNMMMNSVFYLKDSNMYEDFKKEVQKKGLPGNFSFSYAN